MIKQHMGISYNKDREVAKKMYDLLLDKQDDAMERAKILKEQYDEKNKAHADKNPFTTVHELVMELNLYKK